MQIRLKIALISVVIAASTYAILFSLMDQQIAYAHSINAPSKQRIGNYEFEMKAQPPNPVAGQPSEILLQVGAVNNEELVDTQIILTISKNGKILQKTNPIFVPYGHYTYQYIFPEPSTYTLTIDLNDVTYTNQILTFTFPINVVGEFESMILAWTLPLAAGVVAAITGTLVMHHLRKSKLKPVEGSG